MSNETAGEHFTPREVIRLMVAILFEPDMDKITNPAFMAKLYDPCCGSRVIIMTTANSNDEHWLSSSLLEKQNMDWCSV